MWLGPYLSVRLREMPVSSGSNSTTYLLSYSLTHSLARCLGCLLACSVLACLITCIRVPVLPHLEHRPPARVLQTPLSWVVFSSWLQISPNLMKPTSRSRHHEVLGRHLFLLPWGLQDKVYPVMLAGGLRRVCLFMISACAGILVGSFPLVVVVDGIRQT